MNMKLIVHPRYTDLRTEAARIPCVFDIEGELIFHNRNTVKRFHVGDMDWVVKRYKRPHLVQRIIYTFFKPGKARRAYHFAQLLRERGIHTPEGIACIELKKNGLLLDSYFISTLCIDRPIFEDLVPVAHYDPMLADALASFLVHLHQRGVLHGDINLGNILYHRSTDGNLYFTVIDTNRSRFRSSLTHRQCLHNLKRLTHRRDLLEDIVRRYARLRGWNEERCVRRVLHALDDFEQRKALKRRWLKKKS